MAGPWDKYAPAAATEQPPGPWDKYAPPSDQQPPPMPDMGSGAAFDNATLHGMPIIGPMVFGGLDRAVAGARSLYKGTPYADELKAVQDAGASLDAQMAQQHPVANAAGGVAGGIAGTVPMIAAAPEAFGVGAGGLLGRTVLSGMSGGAIGAGDSAIRSGGDLGAIERGGAIGGVAGALGPVVGKGIGAAYNGAFGPAVDPALAGMPGKAQNFAAATLAQPGLAASIQSRLGDLGPQGMLADVSPTWMGVAQGASARPAGREGVINALMGRDAGKNTRLASDLNSSLGAPVVPSQADAALQSSQSALGPQYSKALSGASAVDSTPLADALDTQTVNLRGPAQAALQKVRGFLNIPGTQTLDPNPSALFQTRQAIDGMMTGETNPKVVAALTDARGQVDQMLAKAAPGIKDVDAQFQQLAQQREGLQQGSTIFDTGKTAPRPAEVQSSLDAATQPNGTMIGPSAVPMQMRAGARAELDRIAGQNINDPAALARTVKGEGDYPRQNLSILFGNDNANNALSAVDRESQFFRTKNDVVGNSNTAMRTEFGKAAAAAETPMQFPASASTIGGAAGAVASHFYNAIKAGMAQRAGNRFASSLGDAAVATGPTRDAIIKALMAQAARGSNVGDLPLGAQSIMRALMQSGAQSASGYFANTSGR